MKSVIKNVYAQYTPYGKFWLTIAIGALIVDAMLSFLYGYSQTIWHGLGFAMLALLFSQLPDASLYEWENGNRGVGVLGLLACLPIGIMAYYSHLGYGAGVRVGDIEQTAVQNTNHAMAQKSVESEVKNIDMWRERLAKLISEREQMGKELSWLPTVTADGLKAEIAVHDKDIALESGRGGCKDKCSKLMAKKAELEKRIAASESFKSKADEIAALNTKIEATQRLVDGKVATASKTEYKSSSVVNQTNVAAQIWLAFRGNDPDKAVDPDRTTQRFTNIFIIAGGSLAFLLCAPIGFVFAGRNRIKPRRDDDHDDPTAHFGEQTKQPFRAANIPPVESRYAPPQDSIMLGLIDDKEGMRQLVSRLRGDARIAHRLA